MEVLMVLSCHFLRKPNLGDFHHITVINQGMPVVMFDRVTNDILCDKVIIDDKHAAMKPYKV
jgi:DNA-binding LacI/PurR family transcriptional regulator